MMSRFVRATIQKVAVVVMSVIALVVSSSVARADYTLSFTEGTGVTAVTNTVIFTGLGANYTSFGFTNEGGGEFLLTTPQNGTLLKGYTVTVSVDIQNNSPGANSPVGSSLSVTGLEITGDGNTKATQKGGLASSGLLTIVATATGFDLPSSPVIMTSGGGSNKPSPGTPVAGTTATYMSTFTSTTGSTTLTPLSDASTTISNAGNATSGILSYPPLTTFTLSDTFSISTTKNKSGTVIQGGNLSANVQAAAPAPSSAILALAAVLMFGGVSMIRRRSAMVAMPA